LATEEALMESGRPSYDQGAVDAPLLYVTIGECLRRIAGQHPEKEALVSVHQDRRFTYSQFDRTTDQLAKGLLRLGVKKGDRVGIWAVNCWEWVATQFATAKIGAVLVNINPAYRTHELRYALEQSGTETLVLMHSFKTSLYYEMLLELCPEIPHSRPGELNASVLPSLKNVVLIDGKEEGTFCFEDILEDGTRVPDEDLRAVTPELDPDDDINIQYTSGTTGFPKGVTLTHFNILNNGFHVAQVMRFTEADCLCIPVPFYHCFGMVMSNLSCVYTGAKMVIPCPIFAPVPVFQAVEKEKCTALHGVPTMFIAELNLPDFEKYDLSTLRTGIMAGAPCPTKTMEEVIEKMNMKEVVIAYGQTEASPVTTMTRIEDSLERRVSTVGRVMAWQELKIIDPVTGRSVPRGEQGELCFRGYQVMSRYYNNPQATADTIDGRGWLHSGDLGRMDQEGYVKITGRIKEMVIRGGENLYPREIEEFVLTHPKVMDVYVVGVPDVKYGEELMAWVLPKEGEALTDEEMKVFCKGKIAHFKVPKYWKFVAAAEDFPMTVTGKIQKFKMRETAIEELGLQEAAKIKTA
jgi:fatty-acyl-CoA synthase